MRPRSALQITLQRSAQRHRCVLARGVVDEPIQFGAHGGGGVEAVLDAGRIDAQLLAAGAAQLYAGGVDIELAG